MRTQMGKWADRFKRIRDAWNVVAEDPDAEPEVSLKDVLRRIDDSNDYLKYEIGKELYVQREQIREVRVVAAAARVPKLAHCFAADCFFNEKGQCSAPFLYVGADSECELYEKRVQEEDSE